MVPLTGASLCAACAAIACFFLSGIILRVSGSYQSEKMEISRGRFRPLPQSTINPGGDQKRLQLGPPDLRAWNTLVPFFWLGEPGEPSTKKNGRETFGGVQTSGTIRDSVVPTKKSENPGPTCCFNQSVGQVQRSGCRASQIAIKSLVVWRSEGSSPSLCKKGFRSQTTANHKFRVRSGADLIKRTPPPPLCLIKTSGTVASGNLGVAHV